MIPPSILSDRELITEIISQKSISNDFSSASKLNLSPEDVSNFLDFYTNNKSELVEKQFSGKSKDIETVIKVESRPALIIRDGEFEVPTSDIWNSRLKKFRDKIERAIPYVGRIEVNNHPKGWRILGTGWLVAPGYIVTNRHIAQEFAKLKNNQFVFRQYQDKKISANIDFSEDPQFQKEEFEILEVLFFEEKHSGNADIAFLKIDAALTTGFIPLLDDREELRSLISQNSEIAIIGYPRREKNLDPQILKIFNDNFDIKRLQPGKIIGFDSDPYCPKLIHDCSSLSGNSGSVVIDLTTGKAIGLHYGSLHLSTIYEKLAIPTFVIRDYLARLKIEVPSQ